LNTLKRFQISLFSDFQQFNFYFIDNANTELPLKHDTSCINFFSTNFKCNIDGLICTAASRMAGHLQCNLWPTSVAQLKSFRGQLNFVSSITFPGHMRTISQSQARWRRRDGDGKGCHWQL